MSKKKSKKGGIEKAYDRSTQSLEEAKVVLEKAKKEIKNLKKKMSKKPH